MNCFRSASAVAVVAAALITGTGVGQAIAAGTTVPQTAFCKEVVAYNAQYTAAYAKKPNDLKALGAIKVAGLRRIEKVAPAASKADFEAMAKHYETGAKAGVAVMKVLGVVNDQCKVDLA